MSRKSKSRRYKTYLVMRAPTPGEGVSFSLDAENLNEFLRLNPGVAIETRDDAKCKYFLGQLGVLDLLMRANEPNFSILTIPDYPTHWIVGMLWSGYPAPEQNGYQVVCIPKGQLSEQGLKDFVQDRMNVYGGHDHEFRAITRLPDWPKQN